MLLKDIFMKLLLQKLNKLDKFNYQWLFVLLEMMSDHFNVDSLPENN